VRARKWWEGFYFISKVRYEEEKPAVVVLMGVHMGTSSKGSTKSPNSSITVRICS